MIKLFETPHNDHHCAGSSVTIRQISDELGIVIAGVSCTVCGDGSSTIKIGSTVQLPTWEEITAEYKWSLNTPVWLHGYQEYPFTILELMDQHIGAMVNSWSILTRGMTAWEVAAAPTGYSHDLDKEALVGPDCSLVKPQYLHIKE